MLKQVYNLGGINLYTNPLLKNDGDLIRAVNVESYPYGAKRKRAGYEPFLGTADGSAVTNLFSWTKNDGTLFLYRVSGGKVYYSAQGTGAWTVCDNGTVTAGKRVGHAVLDNTLILGDGAGSTRHTTNGTAFTNTTLAPIGSNFAQFQNRIYLGGTSSTLFYSTTGDAANWNTAGTSDSNSLTIPGEGTINTVVNANDRIIASKSSGEIFRWDGYSLVDTSTELGPSSPYSLAKREGFYLWLNRQGVCGYGGDKPELLSNAIQPQIYNDSGSAIAGTVFDSAPGVVYKYDYLLAVGTITDDFTNETIANAMIKYDYQKNEYLNWSFADNPTSFLSFKDTSGVEQLIFGSTGGQVYRRNGTSTTDNGAGIEVILEFVIHMDAPEYDKKWNWWRGFFNPGCEAQVTVAVSDTYQKDSKKWIGLGDAKSGVVEYRFPPQSVGKFLFIKIKDFDLNGRFGFYGYSVDAEVEKK